MCKHKALSHNENGYIILYNKCKYYQIAFGTTVICLSQEQYEYFKKETFNQIKYDACKGFPQQKIVLLPSFASHIRIIMNVHELMQLADMIGEANVMEEVESILLNKEDYTNYKQQNN